MSIGVSVADHSDRRRAALHVDRALYVAKSVAASACAPQDETVPGAKRKAAQADGRLGRCTQRPHSTQPDRLSSVVHAQHGMAFRVQLDELPP